MLFDEQTPEAVVEAVRLFEQEQSRITPAHCRENATHFGIERFRREFYEHVTAEWERFCGQSHRPERQKNLAPHQPAAETRPGLAVFKPAKAA